MRLINTQTLELLDSLDLATPCKYAVLSHRWGNDEVTFQEMMHRGDKVVSKSGFKKVKEFCRTALSHGYQYGWVDTCCINKADPTELAESINSMFRWYEDSEICIAYLGDVFSTSPPETSNPEFDSSQWFTRGWTLQELLAPTTVIFYSAEWCFLSTKSSCREVLSSITGISEIALRGHNLRNFSLAQRMSWAARRETTKVEDMAYCLLGIFDVSMPLLYGEGSKAFVRLQQTIMQTSDDQSILAWTAHDPSQLQMGPTALAPTPRCFDSASDIERVVIVSKVTHFSFQRKPFSMTNMGISITLPIIRPFGSQYFAVLDCHTDYNLLCIPLHCSTEDGTRFQKAAGPIVTINRLEGYPCEVRDIYLHGPLPQQRSAMKLNPSFLHGRWSTESLEKGQILRHLGGSKSDQRDVTALYQSLIGETVTLMICFSVSCLIWMIFVYMEWESVLPLLGTTAVLCSLTLKGSLSLHVRLFVVGSLSFAGFPLETTSDENRDFWAQHTLETASDSELTSWPYASCLTRYDTHDYDKLLRVYVAEDVEFMAPIVLAIAVIAFLLYLKSNMMSWTLKMIVHCCVFFAVLCVWGIFVHDSIKHQRWLKTAIYVLVSLFTLGFNIMEMVSF